MPTSTRRRPRSKRPARQRIAEAVSAGFRGWAVVSLQEFAEGLPLPDLLRDLRRHLPGGTFYFPAFRKGQLQPDDPLAAYVFVVANRSDRRLLRIERSRYVDRVLCLPHSRCISRLTDQELHRMVTPAAPRLTTGQTVLIQAGDWSGLEGVVVTVLKARVRLRVQLHSRREDVTLPLSDIQPN